MRFHPTSLPTERRWQVRDRCRRAERLLVAKAVESPCSVGRTHAGSVIDHVNLDAVSHANRQQRHGSAGRRRIESIGEQVVKNLLEVARTRESSHRRTVLAGRWRMHSRAT